MNTDKTILPTHHNGTAAPGMRRGKSFVEQQQDIKQERRSRGPLKWNLKNPPKSTRGLAIKNHFVAMVGEYVGTVLFMIFALGGTNVANIPNTSVTGATTAGQDGTAAAAVNTSSLLYIALSFGFSLTVCAWIFFRVSGGLFNPAVSLGMWMVGALSWSRAILLSTAQFLGGITGAAIVHAILPGTLNVRTTLSPGTSVARGLFIEMFLTSMLMITILLLAAEKSKATFLAPIGIGLSLFIAELLGVYYTGGSLNPARSLGPDVVLKTFSGYAWIYYLGPALGATIAAGLYKFLKWMEYETVLGPEADDEKPMVPTSAANAASNAEAGVGSKLVETSGPGLGDLLTVGSSQAVFNLEHNYGERLDNIEALLHQIISSQTQATNYTATTGAKHASAVVPAANRDSSTTFVGQELGPQYHATR